MSDETTPPKRPPLPAPGSKPLQLDPDVVRGLKKGQKAREKMYEFDKDKHYRTPKGTRIAKPGTLKAEAKSHTIWIRHDIWEAAKLRARTERVTLRSVLENALWYYLMERGQNQVGPRSE